MANVNWSEILFQIKKAKGKEKQDVLEKYKDSEILKEILIFLNDNKITTGISSKKLSKTVHLIDGAAKLYDIKMVMEYLKKWNTGKDIDVLAVQQYLHHIEDSGEKKLAIGIITKDLPLGISASTINKVYPGLIEEFKLMKGKKYEGELITEPFTVSLKLDGSSATCFNLEDETYFLSRSGLIIEGLDHIIDFYRTYLPKGFVYCGELLKKNYDELEHGKLFQETMSLASKKDTDKSELQHIIFDMIPYDQYRSKKFDQTFKERVQKIQNVVEKHYNPYCEYYADVEHIPYYYKGITNNEAIAPLLEKVNSIGLEGLMINLDNSFYKFGPQKSLLKVKEFYTMDLLVIGFTEHIRGNKVGSLLVDYKGSKVGVSGITDELRDKWWKNPNEIIGKVIETKYFRATTDVDGKPSLRFATFVGIREDKTFEDISYE